MPPCNPCQTLYEAIRQRARQADVFANIQCQGSHLQCAAKHCEAHADYRVQAQDTAVYVGLYTSDRWLSESIEAQVMHVGDKFEELLEEELVDQGWDTTLALEHFRNDDKEFVFRSAIALPEGEALDGPVMIDQVSKALLAYEACFRELGDMAGHGDDL